VFVGDDDGSFRTTVATRSAVEALLAHGLSPSEIAARLGRAKSTIAYHMRGLGVPVDERCNRRYDWSKIQAFYDEGHSVAECKARFGFSSQSWDAARQRGDIVSRPVGMPLGVFVTGDRNRSHLKARLLRMGVKTNACELCGISTWRGQPLSLALHHVNGRGQDNRLENLQLLCPNCHSQTENFGGRNRRRAAGQLGTP
jgi:hypothetical protein